MSLLNLGTKDVASLAPAATADDAVRAMVGGNVGSIVVIEDGIPCGIVTDRDLVVRVLGRGLNPSGTQLREIMSPNVVTALADCPPDDAAWRLREHAVRRLPIVDDEGRLIGIVTLDDLLGKVAAHRDDVAELLASFHAPYQAV